MTVAFCLLSLRLLYSIIRIQRLAPKHSWRRYQNMLMVKLSSLPIHNMGKMRLN